MSIGNLQFFIQIPWKSGCSKRKSIPRSGAREGRNMRPMARSSSLTITSTWSTFPEGRVRGISWGPAPRRRAASTSRARVAGRQRRNTEESIPCRSYHPVLLTDLARHGNEAHRQHPALLEGRAPSRDHDQLLVLVPHGQDQPPAVPELLLEGLGDPRGRGGDRDRVEGRGFRPPQVAVPCAHFHVRV